MARLKFHKEGQWDECSIMLNNLAGVPDTVRSGLMDIANGIIVPALNETKASGKFVANAASTVRIKGFNHPWVDGSQPRSTGEAIAFSAGAGSVQVMLSGDQEVVNWVDGGTTRAPARPLFEQAWESCRQDVESAVEALIASAIAGGANPSGVRLRNSLGRFVKSGDYGGASKVPIK